MFLIKIANRYDTYDRYWVTRNTLEEAQKVASEYERDNKNNVEIYKLDKDLR